MSVTPLECSIGCWHGNARPTAQSSSTGCVEPTYSCTERSSGTRGGVSAIQSSGVSDRSSATTRTATASAGISDRGYRRLRHAFGCSPYRSSGTSRPAGSTSPFGAGLPYSSTTVCPSVWWCSTLLPAILPAAVTTTSGWPVVGGRQLVPRRGQLALLLRAGGVAAEHRNPLRVKAVRQRHGRAVDAGGLQLGRRVPVVVGAGLVRVHHHRLGDGVVRYSVGAEADRVRAAQRSQRSVVSGQRRHEARVGVRLDQHVVGQPAATGEGPDVRRAVGEGGVLPDDADRHRRDEDQRHEAGGERDRRHGQRARQSGPAPRSRGAKCSQAAYSAIATNSAKKIVLMLIPAIFGIAALNGTP